MRYLGPHNRVIRSENSAKPDKQVSAYLASLIRAMQPVSRSLDYGCGKLRYLDAISSVSDHVTLVDSEIQLSRKQIIFGNNASVREFCRGKNSLFAQNTADFLSEPACFERAFCLNVLPVIPYSRLRIAVASRIRKKLVYGGEAIFVVQYRNSDFDKMLAKENAQKWNEGILIDSLRGPSYFGLISPDHLIKILSDAGFAHIHLDKRDGSAFAFVRRQNG